MSGSLATNLDSNGNGLTALDYRRILQGFYPNPGIVSGGTVTGNSSLTYHVAPTVAVIDRGSDGTRLVYFGGGDTPAVAAGDASNRRIDVIWLKANDPALDGGSKEVVIGVTQGTPSANPVVPSLDSGQLALMEKLVQPGTTNLSTGSGDNRSYNYAIPYGASIGRIGYQANTSTVTQDWRPNIWWSQAPLTTQYLPVDRSVTVRFVYRASAPSDQISSFYARLKVDGQVMTDGQDECPVFRVWARQQVSFPIVLSGGRSHSIDVEIRPNTNRNAFTWQGLRYVEVVDMGVAK